MGRSCGAAGPRAWQLCPRCCEGGSAPQGFATGRAAPISRLIYSRRVSQKRRPPRKKGLDARSYARRHAPRPGLPWCGGSHASLSLLPPLSAQASELANERAKSDFDFDFDFDYFSSSFHFLCFFFSLSFVFVSVSHN